MRKLPFGYSILKHKKELDWIRWVFVSFCIGHHSLDSEHPLPRQCWINSTAV